MKVFISGGCKSGKSLYAQQLCQRMRKEGTPLYYLATMIPADDEDDVRIARHRKEREGCGFETVEVGCDVVAAVDQCNRRGTFLLDSVTALLSNVMFAPSDGEMFELSDGEMFAPSDGEISGYRVNHNAHIKTAVDLTEIMGRLDNIVIVSDFIYSDAFLYDDLTEAYRRSLAYIDKQVALRSDVVLEYCAGNCIVHKGAEWIVSPTYALLRGGGLAEGKSEKRLPPL